MGRRRLVGGVFIALSGLLSAVFLSTSATAAVQNPITVTVHSTNPDRTDIEGPGMPVSGTFNDPANPGQRAIFDNHFAGLIKIEIPGVSGTSFAFCIEISVPLLRGGETSANLDEQDWSAAGPLKNALPNITFILNKYAAGATTSNQEAAAIQSAIWHFSDGFTLAASTPKALSDRAQVIIDDASKNGAVEPPSPALTITPTHLDAVAGHQAGPFTVHLVGSPDATIDLDADTILRDCTTHLKLTSVADGTKFCLFRATAGSPTLTLRAQGLLPSGRIFIDQSFDRQMIILANGKNVPLQVAATATFSASPPSSTTTSSSSTTTSTSTSTTSTTVRPTTTTTVAPTTTTTPASVLPLQIPAQGETAPAAAAPATETLPVTGRRSLSTVLLAVTCLMIGGVLMLFGKPVDGVAMAGAGGPVGPSPSEWRNDLRRQLPWWLRRSRPRRM